MDFKVGDRVRMKLGLKEIFENTTINIIYKRIPGTIIEPALDTFYWRIHWDGLPFEKNYRFSNDWLEFSNTKKPKALKSWSIHHGIGTK